MKARSVLIGGLGLMIAGIVGAAAAPMLSETDFTTVPPKPEVVQKKLEGMKMRLSEAIKAAELVTDGVASAARVDLDAKPMIAEVTAYGAGRAQKVTVSLETGSVTGVVELPRFPGEATPDDEKWITTDSGLMYYDMVEGDGPQPAGPESTVSVHYTGWLVTGDKFDSSRDRGRPATFPLNRVIRGWTEGVGSMHVGGKRKLVIPFEHAYGAGGRPPTIPAKATLIFDVELLEITNQ